jgi:hypothetical protein
VRAFLKLSRYTGPETYRQMAVQVLLSVVCPGFPASLDRNSSAEKYFKEATPIPWGTETNSLISANPFFKFLCEREWDRASGAL